MKMYRQGDLLFLKIAKDAIPKNLQEIKHGIILRGEATGHAHRLVDGELFRTVFRSIRVEDAVGNMIVHALQKTRVIHEEHNTIELEAGFYLVIRQREYSPWKPMYVMD